MTKDDLSSWLLHYRRFAVVAAHVTLWAGSFWGAFLLRFDGDIPAQYWSPAYGFWLLALVLLRGLTFWWAGLFHGLWRYTGARDLEGILKATTLSSAVLVVVVLLSGFKGFPRSILVGEWLFGMALISGLRLGIRVWVQIAQAILTPKGAPTAKKVLVIGIGDTAESLVREIHRNLAQSFQVLGFVDDDPAARGAMIHGIRVYGPVSRLAELIADHEVEEVIVALRRPTGLRMREIVEACRPLKVQVRTLPSVDGLLSGRVKTSLIRDVAIEDLLGRDPVELDTQGISAMISDGVILITGAGGSIGSEMARQVARFGPRRLVLFERSEYALYEIERELKASFPHVEVVPSIGDVTDRERVRTVLTQWRPTVVIHAAAHKHVPMMELNVSEAIKNNVGGSVTLAQECDRSGVDRFVMVSTDKAVNPTSMMGATKRVAEVYIQALARRSQTQFVTVRFGNVLGSTGSVVPLFKEQIGRGGPITVTHPEMRRYFMTIPEASQLVLQAASMGQGSEVFILDMGEPVKIVQLARDLVRLSGLEPDLDIEIHFSGTRPGEKLFEEISLDAENVGKTRHPKIFVGVTRQLEWERVVSLTDALLEALDETPSSDLRDRVRAIVPEYTPTGVPDWAPPGVASERTM